MKKYKVCVQLEKFEGIYETESETEAFLMATEDAMTECGWTKQIEEIEDESGSSTEEVFTKEHVNEIIDKAVKEIEHECSY